MKTLSRFLVVFPWAALLVLATAAVTRSYAAAPPATTARGYQCVSVQQFQSEPFKIPPGYTPLTAVAVNYNDQISTMIFACHAP